MSARAIKHVVVKGRVQGVGFRAYVEDEALRRNLQGWVRNRRDGSVEAVFAGTAEAVDDMIAACRAGPRVSKVESLDQRDGTDTELAERGAGAGFSCLPTV